MPPSLYHRTLPEGLEELEGLAELALDLRWTWSHFSDRLWENLDPETWARTRNPYFIMQSVSGSRLRAIARDESFRSDLQNWCEKRRQYLDAPGWYGQKYGKTGPKTIAYFSMEFGLGEALPIYSGGLGVLAGDHLKTASDLGVPVVGIGLLYQQGYFRQVLSHDGWQLEAFPYNDPTILPIIPVENHEGGLLRIKLQLPGRTLLLRVWLVRIGKVALYLLDSNDPLNSPWDRGITANLYPAEHERRLLQEWVLGFGGWQTLEELNLLPEVCHLNEGHAAFATIARAHTFMRSTGQPFPVALWATRAGNVFTTHTPVEAAFDRYDTSLIKPYAHCLAENMGISVDQFMVLGRREPENANEPFNMAYLAMRGCCWVNGVSRLHGQVSRKLFQGLYRNWPEQEVPVSHVTNGVHMPTWDSQAADEFWTSVCGKDRWLIETEVLIKPLEKASSAKIWELRTAGRLDLIQYVRDRLTGQLQEAGATPETIKRLKHVLDPNVLTVGFARRFTAYKRPLLLLHDQDRLVKLLRDSKRPIQLIVAGKAHPSDEVGKRMVQTMARFCARPDLFQHAVFLRDYDIALAQHFAAGVDVWINSPRRPWEASGTSGMKVLVNGGLNLSELDGWWAEAFTPEVGWALGDGREHAEPEWDAYEADQLYRSLEDHIIPDFYNRDAENIPEAWIDRIRRSMARLTPVFSANRMVREYVERMYLRAAESYQQRSEKEGKLAIELESWYRNLAENWQELRFENVRVRQEGSSWQFEAHVYFNDLDPDRVHVEIYAEPLGEQDPSAVIMQRKSAIPGAVNGYLYVGAAPATRPADHYTLRVVPFHPQARIPSEGPFILWQR